jgi:TatD DNase family protein
VWFDSHCHLQICEERFPVEDLIERGRNAGVVGVMTAATDIESSRRCIELASHDGVWAAAGVHPNSASTWSDDVAAEIDRLLTDDHVVAVGETGLDFYRDEAPEDLQRAAFGAQIDFAKSHGKALVIHTRESLDAALGMLERKGPPDRFVLHCWSGSADQLERALALGAFVSFAGNVSYKSSRDLREVAERVPIDRLLVETDAPFLSPGSLRGQPNEPANVTLVGAAVASARNDDVSELGEQTTQNARVLFGLQA